MRLEIAAVVKKIYSFGQEVGHLEAAKLLRVMEKTTKWFVGKPASLRYRQISHNGISLPSRDPAVFSCKGVSRQYDFKRLGTTPSLGSGISFQLVSRTTLDSAIPPERRRNAANCILQPMSRYESRMELPVYGPLLCLQNFAFEII